jgi:chromosome segregation ATPase
MTIKAERIAAKIEELRAKQTAQQQEAAERASERLRERQAEMDAYPGGRDQWLRNKAQVGVLAEEELPKLRAENESLRAQVERVVGDRESAADVVAAGADRCEELERDLAEVRKRAESLWLRKERQRASIKTLYRAIESLEQTVELRNDQVARLRDNLRATKAVGTDRCEELEREVGRLRKILAALEWIEPEAPIGCDYCPMCWGANPNHKSGCILKEALR